MRKILGILKSCVIFILILAVMLEAASWLYIKYVNTDIPLPTYSFVNAGSKFWVLIDKRFGVWHAPGSSYLHNKSCFVVEYQANSSGMRDKERALRSDAPRVAVLGDSFVEGWGNASEDRLSDRLEAALGREVLNFGTSGGFGNIQEWQQYKYLVKQFDHDVVLLGVLPHNDFTDNSYDFAKAQGEREHRPYLVGSYPDYEMIYGANDLPGRKAGSQWLKSFDFTLREWSSLYRVLRYLGSYRLRGFHLEPRWMAEFQDKPDPNLSFYYDFKPADWDIMRYSLTELVREAKGKKVIIFTIPVHPDFVRYDGRTEPPLTRNLRALAQEQGFVYVDLLEEMTRRGLDAKSLFFVCDNHWSALGNRVAAEILEPYVRQALAAFPDHRQP